RPMPGASGLAWSAAPHCCSTVWRWADLRSAGEGAAESFCRPRRIPRSRRPSPTRPPGMRNGSTTTLLGVPTYRLGRSPTAVLTHSIVLGALAGSAILVWLGATRLLEGAAAGASIPSILGYIAAASSADEGLRGRVVSRFEAATLTGLGLGIVVGPALFGAI